ncbi:class I SAM-dependent methyltransferase [Bacillus sp. FJAT-27445]|uniref:class I SAM-dependent methyltransferase n=1 Tax=Bacillus sp. FJAT-27445 TaxID=1679166 RepID=UPI0020A262EB|nr:methyltransferase domain-containing protein [Bacillus sp. FJAT-27445]
MEADIQNLPFLDHTFDLIVSTYVFCSVPDPIKGKSGLQTRRKNCYAGAHA